MDRVWMAGRSVWMMQGMVVPEAAAVVAEAGEDMEAEEVVEDMAVEAMAAAVEEVMVATGATVEAETEAMAAVDTEAAAAGITIKGASRRFHTDGYDYAANDQISLN